MANVEKVAPTPIRVLTFRELVMPGDLNPAGVLYGGKMAYWLDKAAAMFAMCQLRTENIVTINISNLIFKQPIKSGDVVEFYAHNIKCGKTSLTVQVEVFVKSAKFPDYLKDAEPSVVCDVTFVSVTNVKGSITKRNHGFFMKPDGTLEQDVNFIKDAIRRGIL